MNLEWKSTRKFIFRYIVGYLLACTVLFIGIKWYKSRQFSESKLETMISTVSKFRDITDDPCKYAIFGEPTTAQSQFVKIFIYCDAKSRSMNSMDMRAIKDKTVGGAIRELGRVNGFDVRISDNKIVLGKKPELKNDLWVCQQNRKTIKNFNDELIQKGTVECFNGLTEKEIIKAYATL